jgi:hypothetical protein
MGMRGGRDSGSEYESDGARGLGQDDTGRNFHRHSVYDEDGDSPFGEEADRPLHPDVDADAFQAAENDMNTWEDEEETSPDIYGDLEASGGGGGEEMAVSGSGRTNDPDREEPESEPEPVWHPR